MILLYSRIPVTDSLTSEEFFSRVSSWIKGMKNIPDEFKNLSWTDERSFHIKVGENVVEYEVDDLSSTIAFRVKVVDEKSDLWTTDLVFSHERNTFQIRLAREMKEPTAKMDTGFHLPYFFRKLIEDGYGGDDNGLPVSDRPIFINKNNMVIISDIINNNVKYELPVVFVSHPFFNNEYTVDIYELSKDLAGTAHVLVETDNDVSRKIRIDTGERNAYNGAIDIFYKNDYTRYINNSLTLNQYRYRLSHAVLGRLAMLNIDEEYSISSIRLRNKMNSLKKYQQDENEVRDLRIEKLEEELRAEKDVSEYAAQESHQLEKRVAQLESEIQILKHAIAKKEEGTEKAISLVFTEEEFYEDEIKRILIDAIRQACDTAGDEEKGWRHYHVLKDLLDNNKNDISHYYMNLKKEIEDILRKGQLTKNDFNKLKELKFDVVGKKHEKIKFHGDDRYTVTISNTPSDYRNGLNTASEAIKLIFGKRS